MRLRNIADEKFGGDVMQLRFERRCNCNQFGRCVDTGIRQLFAFALKPRREPTVAASNIQRLASVADIRYNPIQARLRARTGFRKRRRKLGVEISIDRDESID